MAIDTSSIHDTDPVAAFLASKPETGLDPAVFAAEAAAAQATLAPQLEYRSTEDQLDPDPREKAIERILTVAGDYGFTIDEVVTTLRGFRPDMTPAEVREAAYALYDQAGEVPRANVRGLRDLEECEAERYVDLLTDFVHGGAR